MAMTLADTIDLTAATMLKFCSNKGSTLSTTDSGNTVARVVSTISAYLMIGQVFVKVVKPIAKGKPMGSNKYSQASVCTNTDPIVSTIICKSLENFTGGEGTNKVVIGNL